MTRGDISPGPRPGRDEDLRERIRSLGLESGFSAVGFARAGRLDDEAPLLESWLSSGFQAGMSWMARDPERRLDPRRLFPEARSVLVGAMYYRHESGQPQNGDSSAEAPPRISCYARGDDYHDVVGQALGSWGDRIRGAGIEMRSRAVCDTSAVLEKAWAARAGLGWLGRNGCLIHPRFGSWIFLGLLLTDLELEPDSVLSDRCGRCRRCVDACPTAAISEPRVVDSRRCISYRTIEYRGEFDPGMGPHPVEDWLAGCDSCQDVCPWNLRASRSQMGASDRFRPREDLVGPGVRAWAGMEDEEIQRRMMGTALTRIRPGDVRRNARAAAEARRGR